MARLTNFLRIRPELFGGVGRALSSRNYRLYACGHIAHVHGWWGNRLGIGWLTWELTGSAAWLGIVAFAGMIPVTFVAPFGGALADRYGHRRMAIAAGAVGSTTTLALALLTLLGEMTVPRLIAFSALQGIFFGLEFPARQALIPQLVGRENISAAIAFNSTTFQVGAFIGPVLAGVIISAHGPGAAILTFAVSNVWLVCMMILIRHPHPPRPERHETGILSDIHAGLLYLAGNRSLRILLLLSFSSGLLIRPFNELLPGFAAEVFGRGAEGLAGRYPPPRRGAGSAPRVSGDRGRTRGLVDVITIAGLLAPIGFALFTTTTRFPLALVILSFAAMMLLAGHVAWSSLIQNMTAPGMRGRVISINAAISVGSPALGALLMGWLAENIGLRPAVAASAGVALIVVACVLPALRRRRAEMEADPPI